VSRVRRPAVAALALAATVAVGAAAWPGRPAAPRPAPAAASSELPTPSAPALRVGRPVALRTVADESRWAPVLQAATVRAAPGGRAVSRLGTRTPEGTANLVVALGRRTDRRGALWVRVRLSSLPNGLTGWVPRRALGGYTTVDTRLVVDLERLRATLLRAGRPVLRAPVGVGSPAAPTPRGEFYVRDELTDYRSPAYGPLAFGTSARSATSTDWPAGGYVGIHGTDRPDLIPGRVSHGCIRLRNADLLRLARLMPVGTPLTVR
jgi:lipoprotein-anchoring transpeptidase ErfK/SrfK